MLRPLKKLSLKQELKTDILSFILVRIEKE